MQQDGAGGMSQECRDAAGWGSLTFWDSNRLTGMLPPLKISQRVAPKLHLSAGSARLLGSLRHSGATQGMRSTSTGERGTAPLSARRGDPATSPDTLGQPRHLLSLARTETLTPGSLSLMKGGLPLAASPSRVSSTFLAETLPWVIFLSSWGGERDRDRQRSPGPWGSSTHGAEPLPAGVS